ncbi:MAG: hypothetical protein IPK99_02185 [Flavobacteriales bacterium]|nr:hypothetical protein [Flavobacteriales bacterium]
MQRPQVHALLALMIFHAARSEARLDADGAIVLLQDQDRSRWDRALIALGNEHLDHAFAEGRSSTYHIEAAIASLHANAEAYARTDWASIVGLYDRLLVSRPSPIVALNRAVAIAETEGAARGLEELAAIAGLEQQHIYHAVRGELLKRVADRSGAHSAFAKALELARSPAERALLQAKLEKLE